jgi:hypothetical protein
MQSYDQACHLGLGRQLGALKQISQDSRAALRIARNGYLLHDTVPFLRAKPSANLGFPLRSRALPKIQAIKYGLQF